MSITALIPALAITLFYCWITERHFKGAAADPNIDYDNSAQDSIPGLPR